MKRITSFLGKSICPEHRLAALQGAWHERPLNRLDVYAFEPAFNSIMNDVDNLLLKSRATNIKSTYTLKGFWGDEKSYSNIASNCIFYSK